VSITVPDKSEPARKHSAIGISRQQLPRAAQALNAPIPKNPQGALRAVAEGGCLFLAAFNTMRQQSRRKTRCYAGQMRVVYMRIGAKSAGQPVSASIKSLARNCQ
jgi:hypothetical protein